MQRIKIPHFQVPFLARSCFNPAAAKIPADSPNRSMGAISRYDEQMDQLRRGRGVGGGWLIPSIWVGFSSE